MPSHLGDPSIGASPPAGAAVERVGEELARSYGGTLGETQVIEPVHREIGIGATEDGNRVQFNFSIEVDGKPSRPPSDGR